MEHEPFKIILTRVADAQMAGVRMELARLFQIDEETASSIMSAPGLR